MGGTVHLDGIKSSPPASPFTLMRTFDAIQVKDQQCNQLTSNPATASCLS